MSCALGRMASLERATSRSESPRSDRFVRRPLARRPAGRLLHIKSSGEGAPAGRMAGLPARKRRGEVRVRQMGRAFHDAVRQPRGRDEPRSCTSVRPLPAPGRWSSSRMPNARAFLSSVRLVRARPNARAPWQTGRRGGPMASDVHYWSLDEAARRIAARDISSVELTRAILDRISAIDPTLKSYAAVMSERALEDAATLDAETAAGRSRRSPPWRPGGGQGSVRRGRRSDCGRHDDPSQRRGRPGRDGGRQAARVWCRDRRQAPDDRGGVRHAPSNDPGAGQSLEPCVLDRRVVLGVRRRHGRRSLLRVTRLGHGWFDPLPVDHEWRHRVEADMGQGQPGRRVPARRIARSRRPDVPDRARRRDHARRHRRCRPR